MIRRAPYIRDSADHDFIPTLRVPSGNSISKSNKPFRHVLPRVKNTHRDQDPRVHDRISIRSQQFDSWRQFLGRQFLMERRQAPQV